MTPRQYSRTQSVAVLVTSSVAFTAAVTAAILWWWNITNRFGSDTGYAVGLTPIMLTPRALIAFLATTMVLSASPSLSTGWTRRSLFVAAIGLGATSVAILWGWALIAPGFYAPGMAPSLIEAVGFAVAGGVQCLVIKPIRFALR